MYIDDSINNGSIWLNRGIWRHLSDGRLTKGQFQLLLHLLLLASLETHELKMSSKALAQYLRFPGSVKNPDNAARKIRGILAALQDKGYITVITPPKGSHRASTISTKNCFDLGLAAKYDGIDSEPSTNHSLSP